MKPQSRKKLFDAQTVSTELLEAMRHDLSSLKDENEYQRYFRSTQLNKLTKKFVTSQSPAPDEKAFEKFLKANEDMSRHILVDDRSMEPGVRQVLLHAREIIRVILENPSFPEISAEEIVETARHSSGTTRGVPFSDTSIERKFKFPLTSTAVAARYFDTFKAWCPTFYQSVERHNDESHRADPIKVVRGSRLCTVPKTSEISRTISPEPTWNMFLQQGLATMLWKRMEVWGLSLTSDQEKHRRLAYQGSISNSYSTIDFESASDRISVGLIQYLFPRFWFAAIMDIRSPYTEVRGIEVPMHMISTMGNATTFPIETLVLWSFALASTYVYKYCDVSKRLPEYPHWTVDSIRGLDCHTFGDDVIMSVPGSVPLFLRTATCLGMIPNQEKSYFGDEFFRESCGGDFYHGRDVRPFYLKSLPQTSRRQDFEAYWYSVINRIIQKYIQYFGSINYVYDRKALKFCFRQLKLCTDKIKFVPRYYPEDSGITSIEDIHRFQSSYSLNCSPIGIDKNGGLDFKYLVFQYPKENPWNEEIRYHVCLQFSGSDVQIGVGGISQNDRYWPAPVTEIEHSSRVRMLGKYVQRRISSANRPHGYGYLSRFDRS